MLPDGRCSFAVETKRKPIIKDFEEELRELEAQVKGRKEFEEFF